MQEQKPARDTVDASDVGKAPRPPFSILWADFCLAVAFLTRVPVGGNHGLSVKSIDEAPMTGHAAADAVPEIAAANRQQTQGLSDRQAPGPNSRAFARSVWAFPVVGALIGALGGGIVMLTAGSGLHPLASGFLALAAMAIFTGAIHEDGLADFADGLGARDPAKRLEIMRDSRIGAFGVLALIFAIGLKVAAISSMAGPGVAMVTMVAAGAASRAVAAPTLRMLSPARADGLGYGAGIPPLWAVVVSLALGVAALALLWPVNGTGIIGISALGLAAALFMTWVMQTTLGGQTGDGLGAQQQITETTFYLAAASAEIVF